MRLVRVASLLAGSLLGTTPVVAQPPPAGVTSPGDTLHAELFLPGLVSTRNVETGGTLSPDGTTFVFSRRQGRWGESGGSATLYQVRWTGGEWTPAERVPFSNEYDDGDPSFTPDGHHLHFTSTRPLTGLAPESHNIWVVERSTSGWGEPRPLDTPLNSSGREYSPVATAGGALYFASTRPGGLGQGDLYRAEREGVGYRPPENIGSVVNGPAGEWNVFVPPDETYLIFEASGRPTNQSPSGDLYISYAGPLGWRSPVPLTPINTPASELNAQLSPDGQQMYFARSITETDGHRHASIFRVPTAAVLPHLADPRRDGVAVVSRSAHELWIVEAGTWRPLHRIPVGQGPHEGAASPDGRLAYSADYGVYPEPHEAPIPAGSVTWIEESSGTITEVDLIELGQSRVIAVPGCRRNHGMLASADGTRLWTTCEEEATVLEIDRAQGAVLRTWATAPGSHTLATAAGDSIVIVANTDAGTISLIRRHAGQVDQVPTGGGAEGLAVSPDGTTVWVSNPRDGTLSVVDLQEGRVLETVPSGGRFPVKLAFEPDGQTVWVANTASRSITILDAQSRRLLRTIEFETPPLGILIPPGGTVALVTFPRRNELAVLELATGDIVATVAGIMEADGLIWLPGQTESSLGSAHH